MFFSTFPKSTNVDDDTTSENNGGVWEGGKLFRGGGVGLGTLFFASTFLEVTDDMQWDGLHLFFVSSVEGVPVSC
jgi:hypothetical protein